MLRFDLIHLIATNLIWAGGRGVWLSHFSNKPHINYLCYTITHCIFTFSMDEFTWTLGSFRPDKLVYYISHERECKLKYNDG